MRVAFKGFPLSIANGFASRGSPSPSELDSPQGVPPLYSEWDSLQGGPFLQVNGIHLKGFPLHSEWDSLHGVPFSKANGIRLIEVPPYPGGPFLQSEWDSPQGVPPLHSEWDSLQGSPLLQSEWDSLQGIPPLHSDSVSLQGTLLHLDVSTHPVLRLVITPLRDPIRGLLLPIHLPFQRR